MNLGYELRGEGLGLQWTLTHPSEGETFQQLTAYPGIVADDNPLVGPAIKIASSGIATLWVVISPSAGDRRPIPLGQALQRFSANFNVAECDVGCFFARDTCIVQLDNVTVFDEVTYRYNIEKVTRHIRDSIRGY